ncbi:hypothetical protein [Spongiactinospora rosea]|uniref:hypothetical protein n=1 Tax=Spongiactinospora rosea TaxID=2248750 RepID=UPI0011C053AC|nr:hypothetical protein [Spongiactinospora rosea]
MAIEFRDETPKRSFGSLLLGRPAEEVVKIDPLRFPGMSSRVHEMNEQSAYWRKWLKSHEGKPDAILGYCSGAALAWSLAAEYLPEDVPLVLLDPEWTSPRVAQDLLADLCQGMDPEGRGSPVPPVGELAPDDALFVAGGFLRSAMERVAGELPVDILDTLTEKQRAWFSYTLSATAPDARLEPRQVFLSRAGRWTEGGNTRVHRFPTDPWELFRSIEVADAIGRLVEDSPREITHGDRPGEV